MAPEKLAYWYKKKFEFKVGLKIDYDSITRNNSRVLCWAATDPRTESKRTRKPSLYGEAKVAG